MKQFSLAQTCALGAMTLALFLGAGNIIYPPLVGMQAGYNVGLASIGFIVSAVLFPALAIVALALNGGDVLELTRPLGNRLAVPFVCVGFLALGVLFGTPRTATISYELIFGSMGVAWGTRALFSLLFFGAAWFFSARPGRLLELVGYFLSPIKIGLLIMVGLAALFFPQGDVTVPTAAYLANPFSAAFVEGYNTLDVISGICFGSLVANTLRDHNVTTTRGIFKYSSLAALFAAVGLSFIYVCYFLMGANSAPYGADANNGLQIMSHFVDLAFGPWGHRLLAAIITLACLVTALGLTSGTCQFFHRVTGIGYQKLVGASVVTAGVISLVGLDMLTKVAVPVLIAIYPAMLVVVVMGIIRKFFPMHDHIYQLGWMAALALGIAKAFM